MASGTNFSVVIDIGTSKMVAMAGRKHGEDKFEIIGKSKVPAKGIKRGIILNIDEAAAAVRNLIEDLEKQIGEEIVNVSIGYAGQPMRMYQYKTSRQTSGEGIVTQADVDELYQEAKNIQVEAGYKILHLIPQQFIIDGEVTDSVPVGVAGKEIEVSYKIIAVPESILVNFGRVIEKAGLIMDDITLSPVAAGEAVLTDEEKEMGAVMVDIGSGTTKISVYHEGALLHASVIPFGGDVITRDIKEGCAILYKWAEQLKVQYGQALGDFADERKVVTIPGHNGWEPKEIYYSGTY